MVCCSDGSNSSDTSRGTSNSEPARTGRLSGQNAFATATDRKREHRRPLTQVFSDELGWRLMEKQVAEIYRSLPPQDRTQAAIMTMDYGDAAALDVYGRADGLPAALCGQLQYYFWGPHGYDGSVMLIVNGDIKKWSQICSETKVAGSFGAPLTMPYENGVVILCKGLRHPLPQIWDSFKRLH